jgi:uncharacterized membrane protein
VAFILKAIVTGPFWMRFAIVTNIAGVGFALLAAIPGFIDWLAGIPRGTKAKSTGLRHMLFNVAALALFTTTLVIYASHWNGPFKISMLPGIVLAGVGVLCTIAAGMFGWSLVQDHHVGVNLRDGYTVVEREAPDEGMRRAG